MKTLIFTLTLLIILSNTKCQEQNRPFKILQATKQKFYAGVQQAGWWEIFELKIVPSKNSNVLKFDSLWIGDKDFAVQSFQKGKKIKNNTFGPKDTVFIRIRISHNNFSQQQEKKQHIQKKFNGEGLLKYQYKNKNYYIVIEKFNELSAVYYP